MKGALRASEKPLSATEDVKVIITIIGGAPLFFASLQASVTYSSIARQVLQKEGRLMVTWKTDVDTLPLHTVLILSDQQENVAAWEPLFSQRNCIVLAERSVHNALQTTRLVGPSLILVDLQIPKQELALLVRDLRAISRAPILLLVAADTVEEVLEAYQAGADECLVKPINPAVVIVKAMAWLGHGQRSERAPIKAGINITV
ncbi:MAG TPA: response regulator [Anaerolineales bacterium]|nr:response regulator [Anaerolineales bacterium]